jgi:hypothetical protein
MKPQYQQTALNAALDSFKVKTSGDAVAVTSSEVVTPIRLAPGVPFTGSSALPQPLQVVKNLKFIIRTNEFTAGTDGIFAILGTDKDYHNTCGSCPEDENKAAVYLNSVSCDKYSMWQDELCSTTYFLLNMTVKVKSLVAGTLPALPEQVKYSRYNLMGDNDGGVIDIASMEDDVNYNPNKAFVSIPLVGQAARIDRFTKWRITDLIPGMEYTITLDVFGQSGLV